ncbi:uncharacterized protein BO97DRAFT_72424 [Aspergillus homomorphus CBS 101889]|uniref:Uncharacterized protein n=1 Tax=Aspergillus homomorphus (strain CBS 101889) TaxID=1450537 RepID=A0A395I8S2_ASPHC|nr:hypothetical protein BO97DRAFT_72424 [Aspergillus homomorphus CBS 101889]RAL16670.1 hypothetical protein BO97DRAFT_72424 [Aspergillus homomorphus CBS 101889]
MKPLSLGFSFSVWCFCLIVFKWVYFAVCSGLQKKNYAELCCCFCSFCGLYLLFVLHLLWLHSYPLYIPLVAYVAYVPHAVMLFHFLGLK